MFSKLTLDVAGAFLPSFLVFELNYEPMILLASSPQYFNFFKNFSETSFGLKYRHHIVQQQR